MFSINIDNFLIVSHENSVQKNNGNAVRWSCLFSADFRGEVQGAIRLWY
jgi:hypothetical protein